MLLLLGGGRCGSLVRAGKLGMCSASRANSSRRMCPQCQTLSLDGSSGCLRWPLVQYIASNWSCATTAYNTVCVFSYQRAALVHAIEDASPASAPPGQAKLAAGRRFLLNALEERIAVLESEARAAYRSVAGLDYV